KPQKKVDNGSIAKAGLLGHVDAAQETISAKTIGTASSGIRVGRSPTLLLVGSIGRWLLAAWGRRIAPVAAPTAVSFHC
ncbi:hypothetical protein B296_00006332, partial [Ensete ventricosum]